MRFSKWHALGNSYLLIERSGLRAPLSSDAVRRLCDGDVGIGADGVLEVVSTSDATAEVVIWNPDGSVAELSGNGTRIAALWLARLSDSDEVTIAVGERVVRALVRPDGSVETELGTVTVFPAETIDVAGEDIEVIPVSVGNPHAVVRREPAREELLRLGPLIERHARFPERTNVQLARADGAHDATVAVWERGAGETLASGTSACAVAAAGVANGWLESPVTVHLAGGSLAVVLDVELNARLVGPAQEICRGELSEELAAELGL